MTTADLSEFHEPITELFKVAPPDAGVIGNADIDAFREKGYLSGIKLLGESQLEALRTDADALMSADFEDDERFYEFNLNESADPNKRLFHALGAWRVSPAFHDLIFYGPLVNAASLLLGGPVRLWHDQIFTKPPADGGIVAWHQDYSYWTRTKPVAHLTCWIALDDSTVENGCVQYVPGSHEWELLPRGPLADDMDSIKGLLPMEQIGRFAPFAAELPAGYASFHHPLTLHGSYENKSALSRRAAVVNFVRDGVQSGTDEPLLAGAPVIARDHKIEGRLFPLLGDGAKDASSA